MEASSSWFGIDSTNEKKKFISKKKKHNLNWHNLS